MRKEAFSVSLQLTEGQKHPPDNNNFKRHAGNGAAFKEKSSVKHAGGEKTKQKEARK